jgi:hypothetical protein
MIVERTVPACDEMVGSLFYAVERRGESAAEGAR